MFVVTDNRYVGHVLSNVHVPGSDPIWLDNVVCTDSCLDHLSQCNHSGWGVHNCTHRQDVSIACYDRNATAEWTTNTTTTTTPAGKSLQTVTIIYPNVRAVYIFKIFPLLVAHLTSVTIYGVTCNNTK